MQKTPPCVDRGCPVAVRRQHRAPIIGRPPEHDTTSAHMCTESIHLICTFTIALLRRSIVCWCSAHLIQTSIHVQHVSLSENAGQDAQQTGSGHHVDVQNGAKLGCGGPHSGTNSDR